MKTMIVALLMSLLLMSLAGCAGPLAADMAASHDAAAAAPATDTPAPASTATTMPSPAPTATPAPKTALQTVEEFYSWYLDYIGEGEKMRNPLVDRAYADSEYLTPAFVEKVDRTIAGFDKGGYDPFLCAQDIPLSVAYELQAGAQPAVTVHMAWSEGSPTHDVTVLLAQVDGAWNIDDIICPASREVEAPAMEPQEVVQAFYDWYLGYIGQGEDFRNPLVDKAYRESELLTYGFVQKVDGILAGFEAGGYDPFLCAQDVPQTFAVSDVVADGDQARATVEMRFGEGSPAHAVEVALDHTEGRWLIGDIFCVEPAPVESAPAASEGGAPAEGWELLSNEEYGFEMQYPAGWRVQDGLGTPAADMPTKVLLSFAPADWPGMGEAASLIVMQSTEDQFREFHPLPAAGVETLEINGQPVSVEPMREGVTRYVFQSQAHADVRAVLIDGLPAMEALGKDAGIAVTPELHEIVQAMIASFRFAS